MTRPLVVAAALVAAAGAAPGRGLAASHDLPFHDLAGLVTVDPGGRACLSIGSTRVARGTPLTLVLVPVRGTLVLATPTVPAVIDERLAEPCSAGAEPGHAFYRVETDDRSTIERGQVYVGIVGANVSVRAVRGVVTTDLGRPGALYELIECTSREGIHFRLLAAGQRRWQRYHYLGYDVEPTCED